MKKIFLFLSVILFSSNLNAKEVTFEQILKNPTDLELNLKYAKEQEKAGNLKSTIHTLERLNMLYPANTDIKIYLLSILLKMDSQLRVQLMIERMLKDPNTTDEAKEYVNQVTSQMYVKKDKKKSDWFAYADIGYSKTEHSNVEAVSKSGTLWVKDSKLEFASDSIEKDNTYSTNGSLTIGKNLNKTSAVSLNLGLDLNSQFKSNKEENDILSSSLSYSKSLDKHFFLPYIFYSRPNNRNANDSNSKGIGFSNSYFFNKENNISYGASLAHTNYDTTRKYTTANKQNSDVFSANINFNHYLTPKDKLNSKIFGISSTADGDYNSYDQYGLTLGYSKVIPIGLLKFETTYKQKRHGGKDSFINSSINREDMEINNQFLLTGQINNLLPYFKKFNMDNSIFYTLKWKRVDVDSTLVNYTLEGREYLTYGLTKKLNLNELF